MANRAEAPFNAKGDKRHPHNVVMKLVGTLSAMVDTKKSQRFCRFGDCVGISTNVESDATIPAKDATATNRVMAFWASHKGSSKYEGEVALKKSIN